MQNSNHELSGAVTSTGQLGKIELRTHDRVGLNYDKDIHSYQELTELWETLVTEAQKLTSNQKERRRIFLRTWISKETYDALLEQRTSNWSLQARLETAIPESIINPNINEKNQRYLVTLAYNDHNLEIGFREIWRYESFINHSSEMRMNRAEHVNNLSQKYEFIDQLEYHDDLINLTELWENTFGWTQQGIESVFLNRISNTKFIGVRNRENDQVVAACMAEWFEYNGYWYIELTEWRSKINGIASAMIEVLIACILEELYYNKPENERLPLLFLAEQNLFHADDIRLNSETIDQYRETLGSPGAGLSAGLRSPGQFNLLEHNVLVDEGRQLPGDELDENINLNNFVLGVLYWQTIANTYSSEQTAAILEKSGVIYESNLQP